MIKNSLELLLIYLLRQCENQSSPQEFFVSKIASSGELQDEIVRYLSARVYGTFSLDELCAEIHYGKTHLCTFFKKQTGKTIYRTYLKLKTDEAEKTYPPQGFVYRNRGAAVLRFAGRISTSFQKLHGMTPGEYKKSINSSDVR